jgi:putative phosphoribosyl transferase
LYRNSTSPPDITGRAAVIVDDGIATGYTMLAAIRAVRSLTPAAVVVATPVASVEAAATVRRETVCLDTPEPFIAVGLWYQVFTQVEDAEVVELLRLRKEELQAEVAG